MNFFHIIHNKTQHFQNRSAVVIICTDYLLRTVGAFRKQSGGLFLAPPQQLRCEDPQEQRDK